MIDYEKLKKIEELCNQTDGYYFECYVSSKYDTESFTLCHPDKYDGGFNSYDELLEKLQSILQPKPKYEIGQKVWVLATVNDILEVEIIEFDLTDNIWKIKFQDGFFAYFYTDRIFPTKESLIQSQIDYWTKLKQEEHPENKGIDIIYIPPTNHPLECKSASYWFCTQCNAVDIDFHKHPCKSNSDIGHVISSATESYPYPKYNVFKRETIEKYRLAEEVHVEKCKHADGVEYKNNYSVGNYPVGCKYCGELY